jgi:hypothetical protein
METNHITKQKNTFPRGLFTLTKRREYEPWRGNTLQYYSSKTLLPKIQLEQILGEPQKKVGCLFWIRLNDEGDLLATTTGI